MATAPNWVAEKSLSDPPQLPNGVRTADTIYTSFIWKFFKKAAKSSENYRTDQVFLRSKALIYLITYNVFDALFRLHVSAEISINSPTAMQAMAQTTIKDKWLHSNIFLLLFFLKKIIVLLHPI
jgi:hypothetical protein